MLFVTDKYNFCYQKTFLTAINNSSVRINDWFLWRHRDVIVKMLLWSSFSSRNACLSAAQVGPLSLADVGTTSEAENGCEYTLHAFCITISELWCSVKDKWNVRFLSITIKSYY